MSGVVSESTLAFDRAGNITSDGRSLTGITGDAGTNTQSFTYDALRRLTGSSGLAAGSTSNQYDLDGNRTRRVEGAVTTDFTYDRADQVVSQLIGVTSRTFDYDRYGNLVTSNDNASATTTYAYDEANRLTTISPPGGAPAQITFTIDALDRQATRTVGGTPTDTYSFLDATEVAWQSGQGSPTTSLLDADGSRLAVKTGGTVSWVVFDLHGSAVALCPAGTSTLADAYRFDGFGQQVASAGTATNPWRYRGLLNVTGDFGSGALLDMTARHYSPQLGAFSQQDSVQGSAANPLSMNRFLYAHANPATLIDPDGHYATELDCSACYAIPATTTTIRSDARNPRRAGGPRAPAPPSVGLPTTMTEWRTSDQVSIAREWGARLQTLLLIGAADRGNWHLYFEIVDLYDLLQNGAGRRYLAPLVFFTEDDLLSLSVDAYARGEIDTGWWAAASATNWLIAAESLPGEFSPTVPFGAAAIGVGSVRRPVVGRNSQAAKSGGPYTSLGGTSSAVGSWGNPRTLKNHFERHGVDFGAKDMDEYARMASDFLARALRQRLPIKIDADGTLRAYDPATNTFGSYRPDGTTRTFYKPRPGPGPNTHRFKTNAEYWENQNGDLVKWAT